MPVNSDTSPSVRLDGTWLIPETSLVFRFLK